MHITLVPASGGSDDNSFVASVTDDDTGGVYSLQPDGEGRMVVEERMQEDFPPESEPLLVEVDGNVTDVSWSL